MGFRSVRSTVAAVGCLLLGTLSLAGGLPPTIEYPPTAQSGILGGPAIFTVIASGDAPLSYQWRQDGEELVDAPGVAGATSDVLLLSDLAPTDAGDYSVVVTNAFGDATSADAALTLNPPQGGAVDFSFDPGSSIDGSVEAVAVQADGRVLIGGSFTTVGGVARGGIARLNPDGSVDHTFGRGLAGASSTVRALAVQPDGRVLIGGDFSSVNGVSRGKVARLNADGSLDTTFLNGLAGANSWVYALAVQTDGRVLIVGDFFTVNGVSREHVARLHADGSLDTTFLNGLSGANSDVFALAVQPDGRVLIGGLFTAVNGVSRGNVARLHADGSLDTTFLDGLAGASSSVRALAVQPDGRVLIGGQFTTVNGVSRERVARLYADGSLDTTFLNGLAGADGTVSALAVQPDGRVLIGGNFTLVNGVSRNRVARLNVDGSLDTTFLNGLAGVAAVVGGSVDALAMQPDGRVLIGGEFTTVNGVSRNQVARLNVDGSLDTTFLDGLAGANDTVNALAVQPDGRVLIGGWFTTVNGVSRNRVARLNADGSLDTTFGNGLAGANNIVYALAVQPDGRVLIGGNLTTVNGVSRSRVARLNADGSLDTTFLDGLAGASSTVRALAVQPDGRVVIGGQFTTVNGVSRTRIARLNADGSLDTTFGNGLAGASSTVSALAVQPDGRVLIGGSFTTVNGVSRNRVARLNVDGSLDTTFLNGLAGASNVVEALAVQPDGRVLIGGSFTTVNGVSRGRVARLKADGSLNMTFLNGLAGANGIVWVLAVQPDGRVLIGGDFTTVNGVSRNYLARLNADGSLDTTFLNGLAGANDEVLALAVQPDGRVLIGGDFTTVNGVIRPFVARLHGAEPVVPTITTDPSSKISYDACCAVFHVEASGTPLDYRWRKDGFDLVDGANVSGAASSKLVLTGVTATEAGAYSVVVSNFLGSDTSANATLSISSLAQCQAGTCDYELGCLVSNSPNNSSCDIDANVCTADSCQSGVCGAAASCSCIHAPDADGDGYGDAGNVTSASCGPPPGSVGNADDCDDGQAAVFPGAAEVCDSLRNDCGDLDWPALEDFDRDLVEDACDNCPFLANADQADIDFDGVGDACDPPDVPATIDYPPTPQSGILGGQAIFTVIASGNAPLSYQWRQDGVDLVDAPGVAGATSDALDLSDLAANDAGDYSVVVTNAFGDATSADVALTVSVPQGGDVDFSFDPGSSIDGSVDAVALQADGKVLIGGEFTTVGGAARGGIARLKPDGSVDHTFGNGLAGANSTVYALAVQPDGRVLIGGQFTSVNGVSRNRVARLHADGSLDTTFLNGLFGPNDGVFALALQPDGRVLIGGNFYTVNGVSRGNVARLNADGSLDTTFLNGLAGTSTSVHALALQPDGRVLIGGAFTTVNGVSRNRVARLNADGSLDTTFLNGLVGPNDGVLALAVQPDGRVLIGGYFTKVNGASHGNVARLHADGSLDTAFLSGLAGADSHVGALALQPDGRVLIGGDFWTFDSVSRKNVARLHADGSLDTTFLTDLAGANNIVYALALQPDGQLLIGGYFTTVNGASRGNVARLHADGSLDTTFLNGLAGTDTEVFALAVQPDGRVLIGGEFTTVNGVSRGNVARLHADGSLDTTFGNGLAGASGTVRALALQPDGRVLIGGEFTTVNGVSRGNVARLHADGSLDTTFGNGLAGASGTVRALALQPDGRVLIGGWFTAVNGVSRNHVARLHADGSLDTTFLNGLAGPSSIVHALAVQPDGRVLIGGWFWTVNGVSRNRVARLNADGSLDTTFLNGLFGPNDGVFALTSQPDGRVLIGGNFYTVNGVSRGNVARLNADGSLDTTFLNALAGANFYVHSLALQPDGRLLIGGSFTTVNGASRGHVARLNVDGSLDTTFGNGLAGANSDVFALAVQPDDRVLIGGFFGTVNDVSRSYVARLHGAEPAVPTITTDPSAQTSYDACCAVFHVEASGTPLDYRWRKDGSDLADGGNVSGAASSKLLLTNVTAADAGAYSVVVSNFLGSDTSTNAALSISSLTQCQSATCDSELGCMVSNFPNNSSCDLDAIVCTADSCQSGDCAAAPCSCVYAPDADGDGYGDSGSATTSCDETLPPDSVGNADDCNDGQSSVFPGAGEVCDSLSNDCGAVDWPALVDFDRDLVEDACDNCPSFYNPDQFDSDGDDSGDLCDSCPTEPDPDQADADQDGVGDVCDCAVMDPTNSPSPSIGPTLQVSGDGIDTLLTWDDGGIGGPYRLYRGYRATPDAFAYNHACLDASLAQNSVTDSSVPPTHRTLYYLVTRLGGCGESDPGSDSQGTLRPQLDPTCSSELADLDDDGTVEALDNCPGLSNGMQADTDADGHGNACDSCSLDSNPLQEDLDQDGAGDVCDPDDDGDGTDDEFDNCPRDQNPLQTDSDLDLTGDVCDNCPQSENPDQSDSDFDGVGDACEMLFVSGLDIFESGLAMGVGVGLQQPRFAIFVR